MTTTAQTVSRKLRIDRAKLILITGTILGFVFVLYLQSSTKKEWKHAVAAPLPPNAKKGDFKIVPKGNMDRHESLNAKLIQEDDAKALEKQRQKRNVEEFGDQDKKFAREVHNIRVLCMVLTSKEYYKERAMVIEKTWGQRCNKLLLISSEDDTNPKTISLPNVKEDERDRNWTWAQTREGFKYVWEHHRDDAEWFIRVEDFTYVILENLRLMLHGYDATKPMYFGLLLHQGNTNIATHAASDYVLSKESLRRFVEEALPNEDKCKGNSWKGIAHRELGHCLSNVGVFPEDSRDQEGRHRFMALHPLRYLQEGVAANYPVLWNKSFYPQQEGPECCSDTAISFNRVAPDEMNVLEYQIYRLHPAGVFED